MNTNNLKPEIEMLKQESAPQHLKAQIVTAILNEQKSKTMTTKKIIGFGLPAIALGIVATGAIMAPKTAIANPIAQVRNAFEAVRDYQMTTYQVVDGKRERVSESWVTNGKRKTFTVENDGTLTELSNDLIEVQTTVKGALFELKPIEVATSEKVKGIYITAIDKEQKTVPGKGLITVEGKHLGDISPTETFVISDSKNKIREGRSQAKSNNSSKGSRVEGKPIEIEHPIKDNQTSKGKSASIEVVGQPIFVSDDGELITMSDDMLFIVAEMSIESLQKLLEDETLWTIEPNQWINGQLTNRYRLKESFINFTVYVDPKSKLPVLTRQIQKDVETKKETTIEVEYNYGVRPPTEIKK